MEPSYPLVLSETELLSDFGHLLFHLIVLVLALFFCHFKANDMFESTCSSTTFAGDDGPAWPVQCIWEK